VTSNILDVRYGVEWHRDAPDKPARPLLAPVVCIDSRSMLDRFTLDVRELVASTGRNGEFWLFTCGCGTPECAGIYHPVELLHAPDDVIWRVPFPMTQSGREDPSCREYVFQRQAYFDIVGSALAQAKGLAEKFSGDVDVGPYGFEVEELQMLSVGPPWK
jgi:hypothetical protein